LPPSEASARPAERRVVVTGWGLVTPLGGDVESSWAAAAAGRSGTREITRFDARGLTCRVAAEVDDAFLPPPEPGQDDPPRRVERLLLVAAREAVSGAGAAAAVRAERTDVVLGNHGTPPRVSDLERSARLHDDEGRVRGAALEADAGYDLEMFDRRRCDHAATLLARAVGARGRAVPITSACAAGTQAIGIAARRLRDGSADLALAGGAESYLDFAGFVGFVLLGALCRRWTSPDKASRPFDRRRTGFVMGEAAGIVVLETLAHARTRGARVLGEVLGYGDSADAFRITDQDPEGTGAVLAMRRALADAGLSPEDVDYVNAHGTGTPLNDPLETLALKRVLGERAREVPVSSNKSMVGHSLGAAGAVEAILAWKGIEQGVLLPTINLEAPDPKCDLDYVPNEARRKPHRVALSNSFGFGGQNACLALGGAS
jgi:3-oxoacyl-[acyl-carrier-protein] synthase II